jgi:hypothetical protein
MQVLLQGQTPCCELGETGPETPHRRLSAFVFSAGSEQRMQASAATAAAAAEATTLSAGSEQRMQASAATAAAAAEAVAMESSDSDSSTEDDDAQPNNGRARLRKTSVSHVLLVASICGAFSCGRKQRSMPHAEPAGIRSPSSPPSLRRLLPAYCPLVRSTIMRARRQVQRVRDKKSPPSLRRLLPAYRPLVPSTIMCARRQVQRVRDEKFPAVAARPTSSVQPPGPEHHYSCLETGTASTRREVLRRRYAAFFQRTAP